MNWLTSLQPVDRCGWPVKVTRVRSWRCTEPFGHDHEHAIRYGEGPIAVRSAGFSMEPIDEIGHARGQPETAD